MAAPRVGADVACLCTGAPPRLSLRRCTAEHWTWTGLPKCNVGVRFLSIWVQHPADALSFNQGIAGQARGAGAWLNKW